MNEQPFENFLKRQTPMLQAWGEYVLDYIQEEVKNLPESYSTVQKYEGPRVKDIKSALNKIIRKNYTNPITQMTDLVGLRVVVLLKHHIPLIDNIIENNPIWNYRKDRNIDTEISNAPTVFAYQSNHYIITLKDDLWSNNIKFEKGITCEIQIRTLLQHAFAVTTHDTLYKPNTTNIPTKAERFMASSMALMETADHLMCETMELVNQSLQNREEFYSYLLSMYHNFIETDPTHPDKAINLYVIEQLNELLEKHHLTTSSLQDELTSFIDKNPFVPKKLKEHKQASPIFWQEPMSLLAYLLCDKDPRNLRSSWPLAIYNEQMETLFADLGERFTT